MNRFQVRERTDAKGWIYEAIIELTDGGEREFEPTLDDIAAALNDAARYREALEWIRKQINDDYALSEMSNLDKAILRQIDAALETKEGAE